MLANFDFSSTASSSPLCFRSFGVLYLTLLLYCPPELPLRVMMSCLVLKSFLYCPLRLPLLSAVPSSLVLKSLVYCPPEIVACTIAACASIRPQSPPNESCGYFRSFYAGTLRERERERETAVLRTKTAQSKKEPAERPAAGEPASQRGARTKEKDRGHTGCRWPGSGPYLLLLASIAKKTPHRHRESKLRYRLWKGSHFKISLQEMSCFRAAQSNQTPRTNHYLKISKQYLVVKRKADMKPSQSKARDVEIGHGLLHAPQDRVAVGERQLEAGPVEASTA